MEVGVGLKHPLYLMTEGVSDIGVLSQSAKKHTLQTDATVEEGTICSFFFFPAGLPKAPICSDLLAGLLMKLPSLVQSTWAELTNTTDGGV